MDANTANTRKRIETKKKNEEKKIDEKYLTISR